MCASGCSGPQPRPLRRGGLTLSQAAIYFTLPIVVSVQCVHLDVVAPNLVLSRRGGLTQSQAAIYFTLPNVSVQCVHLGVVAPNLALSELNVLPSMCNVQCYVLSEISKK
jgi:hypothetical protein